MARAKIDKRTVTIDNDTGDRQVEVRGKVTGFAQGFQDYVIKGNVVATPDVAVSTGQYPEGHEHAGKWAIQIMIAPFAAKPDADTIADRLAPKLETWMQIQNIITKHAPALKRLADK